MRIAVFPYCRMILGVTRASRLRLFSCLALVRQELQNWHNGQCLLRMTGGSSGTSSISHSWSGSRTGSKDRVSSTSLVLCSLPATSTIEPEIGAFPCTCSNIKAVKYNANLSSLLIFRVPMKIVGSQLYRPNDEWVVTLVNRPQLVSKLLMLSIAFVR